MDVGGVSPIGSIWSGVMAGNTKTEHHPTMDVLTKAEQAYFDRPMTLNEITPTGFNSEDFVRLKTAFS